MDIYANMDDQELEQQLAEVRVQLQRMEQSRHLEETSVKEKVDMSLDDIIASQATANKQKVNHIQGNELANMGSSLDSLMKANKRLEDRKRQHEGGLSQPSKRGPYNAPYNANGNRKGGGGGGGGRGRGDFRSGGRGRSTFASRGSRGGGDDGGGGGGGSGSNAAARGGGGGGGQLRDFKKTHTHGDRYGETTSSLNFTSAVSVSFSVIAESGPESKGEIELTRKAIEEYLSNLLMTSFRERVDSETWTRALFTVCIPPKRSDAPSQYEVNIKMNTVYVPDKSTRQAFYYVDKITDWAIEAVTKYHNVETVGMKLRPIP
jgi:hypothetical protein